MEPPGGVPPDRDRQLVLRNPSTALIPLVVSHSPASHPVPLSNAVPVAVPAPSPNQVSISVSVVHATPNPKPTSLSLQPQAVLQAVQQLSPSVGGGGSSGSTSGNSPALASTATAISATTQAATAFSGSSVGHHHLQHHQHQHPHPQPPKGAVAQHHGSVSGAGGAPASGANSGLLGSGASAGAGNQQQTIEKLSRPMAFDKMEMLVREMQDQEHGVPVRQQKMFLTSIPYAFMGYDLIEWLMDRLQIEESEALNIANQLCLHGYFFPVNDSKTLTVKDDSSLYRFQTPYYWPWQHKAPDNVEYAIYLAKRSLRNKQRHALEDYEAEALASLHKNLKGKWDFISMQAEEQVRLAKERKKGDKIVGDSQERAYWRVHRPPPGQFTPLEPCPVPSRDRQGLKPNKKKTVEDLQRDVDYLSKSLNRTRMKMSLACESLVGYSETFTEYDFFLQPALPSNPWVTEDIAFWQLNSTFVDVPTEKRVKRWAISIEELVSDPTGLQEFTSFLEKEYSHENIRFWIAVNRLRRSAHSQVARKVNEIYEEFLKPGAPCEINIDGKTMESVLRGLKNPSRFTFDSASEHIYMLLLKKDCYPRFIRSEHYKRLLDTGIQPSSKKRFFNFGGVSGAKKKMTAALSSQPNLGDAAKGSGIGGGGGGSGGGTGGGSSMMQAPPPGSLSRRRGSDRSLTGSAHELAVIGVNKDAQGSKVPHSHSQSNLSEIPFRETPKTKSTVLEPKEATATATSAVCPWDEPAAGAAPAAQVKLSVCPWEQESTTAPGTATATSTATELAPQKVTTSKANTTVQPLRLTSTSSDSSEVNERMQRNLGIRHQNTVDSGEASIKRLVPSFPEQRRASVSFTPSHTTDYQLGGRTPTTTSSPIVGNSAAGGSEQVSVVTSSSSGSFAPKGCAIVKDPPSGSDGDADLDEELSKLSLGERNSESSASELPIMVTTPLEAGPPPPPLTKVTPPPLGSGGESPAKVSEAAASSPSKQPAVTPVTPLVKEVQIELIEAGSGKGLEQAGGTPPTIRVLELEVITPEEVAIATTATIVASEDQQDMLEREEDLRNARLELEPPEELSPTTDEYQEGLQFGTDAKDAVDDYESIDTDLQLGYIPPAPTPAPSMAPLAELDMDVDAVDDDPCESCIPCQMPPAPDLSEYQVTTTVTVTVATSSMATPTSSNEEARRRRKKRNSESKKLSSSQDEKDKDKEKEKEKAGGSSMETTDHNAVCPWEDENVSANDGTFVKTYATLGYL